MNIKYHIKETIKLSVPISLGFIFHMMLGIVDSAMVGKLIGPVPLAASSLVNSLFIIILVLGIGMSVAITPLVAIAKGGGDKKYCGVLLRNSLIVNLFFSFFLFAASYTVSYYLDYLNQPEEVVNLASSYMRIVSFSVFPLMIFQSYRQFLDGLGETIPPTVVNFFANIINAAGNWILITGKFGMPQLELDGAGYATLLTRIFVAIAIMMYVTKSERFKVYNPYIQFKEISAKVMRKIFQVGAPTALQMFFEVGAFSLAAVMVGWISAKALAAHQIALSMASFTFLTTIGIASAATIRVGNELGRENYTELKKTAYVALIMGVSLMFCFGVLFIIFKNVLPYIFVDDTEVISIASSLLIIAAFFQIFDGAQAVSLGILRGMVDVKVPMIMAFICYWIISIPLSYYLGFVINWGVAGIWIALSAGLVFAAVFFISRIKTNLKKLMKNTANA